MWRVLFLLEAHDQCYAEQSVLGSRFLILINNVDDNEVVSKFADNTKIGDRQVRKDI